MTPTPKKPHPIDIHVGSRIRMARTARHMSQEKLAESCGITFQQIQKYEKGANRVGASRMAVISDALGVSISYFYEGAPGTGSESVSAKAAPDAITALYSSAEGYHLAKAFTAINDPKVRSNIIRLMQSLAAEASEDAAISQKHPVTAAPHLHH